MAKTKHPYPGTPLDAHEWVSFEDPDELRTWVFDVTFMLSGWECIYGHGCQGVLTGPAPELVQGCCSYGAHFTGDADVARIKKVARTLKASEWQFKSRGRDGIITTDDEGTRITKLVDDACIFLNRPGFASGPGCALHQVALTRGVEPLTLKPDVCWQLPIRREDTTEEGSGHVTSTVTQWDRQHWGEGGEEFHWWCTEAPEAYASKRPVYVAMAAELKEMVGPKVYKLLSSYLEARNAKEVPLPHPVVRKR